MLLFVRLLNLQRLLVSLTICDELPFGFCLGLRVEFPHHVAECEATDWAEAANQRCCCSSPQTRLPL